MRTRLFHRLDSSCLATTRELSDVEVLSAISTRGRLYVQLPKPYVDQCELLDECIALFSAVEILPCRKSTWVQNNCLIAVSGSSNDGTAGLAADDSLFDFLMKNPQPLRLANWNRRRPRRPARISSIRAEKEEGHRPGTDEWSALYEVHGRRSSCVYDGSSHVLGCEPQ